QECATALPASIAAGILLRSLSDMSWGELRKRLRSMIVYATSHAAVSTALQGLASQDLLDALHECQTQQSRGVGVSVMCTHCGRRLTESVPLPEPRQFHESGKDKTDEADSLSGTG
ncbi:hypothetical protein KIPB_011943, partial [Kipferlia bialata]